MKTRRLSTALVLTVLTIVPLTATRNGEHMADSNRSSRTLASALYGTMPLSFEANQGQTAPEVQFLSRGRGYSLFLSPDEVVLSFLRTQDRNQAKRELPPKGRQMVRSSGGPSLPHLRIRFEDANPLPELVGMEELDSRSHYIRGSDPDAWHSGVSNFSKVKYRDLYPGVDLLFYGNEGQLEFDFIVDCGSDSELINLSFVGCDDLRIDEQGNLKISLYDGEICLKRPKVYQEIAGVRQEVSGKYQLKGKQGVAFQIGQFDPTGKLVIDPILTYSTFLGGNLADVGYAISVDGSGGIYIAGLTSSADFPLENSQQTTLLGPVDAFISKLNPDGRSLAYSTYLGGSGQEFINDITVDFEGHAYVVGDTNSLDFPMVGAAQPVLGGEWDVFVAKLSTSGNQLLYSSYLGGSDEEYGRSVLVDSLGNSYVVGFTESEDFPTEEALQSLYGGGYWDSFVSKFSPTGNELVFSTYLGGNEDDFAAGSGFGVDGSLYIGGGTNSTDFPVKEAFQSTNAGNYDAFVAQLTSDGSALLFSTYFGGNAYEMGKGIAVDTEGDVYLVGSVTSKDLPTTDSLQSEFAGGNFDGFAVKLNASGIVYSTYLGGGGEAHTGDDEASAVAVDLDDNAYIVGSTSSPGFPLVNPLPGFSGGGDAPFLAKLDASGATLHYSTYLGVGGPASHSISSISLDASGSVYLTGGTDWEALPLVNPLQRDYAGGANDVLVLKISDEENLLDSDGDGAPDETEEGAPNDGDGNNDGKADSEQANVASLPNSLTGGYVTLESAAGTTLNSVTIVENPSPADVPPGVAFPLGFFEFSVEGMSAGGTAPVELFVSDGIELDSYYKYGPTPQDTTPHWYEFLYDGTTGAEILQDRILLHFVDGQRGDDDLTANSQITEPGGPAQTLSSFYFPQFADGAVDTLQFQSTLILANTGLETSVRVELYSTPDGAPMSLRLGELGTDSLFEFTLGEGESVSLPTLGIGQLQVGYARVLAGEDVGGVVVFRRTDLTTGVSLYEAGVPASTELTEFCLFVDSLGVRDTGFALVYPPHDASSVTTEVTDANVTLRLYDKQYNLIAERTLDPMAPGSHTARFVYQMFDDPTVKATAQEMEGILAVESDRPLVAVTVRQNDDPMKEFSAEVPILTTFPVIPGVPGANGHQSLGRSASQAQLLEAYGTIPLRFEANQGQTNPEVQFLSRGLGYSLFLTSKEAVFAFRKHQEPSQVKPDTCIRIQFEGANPSPRLVGKELLVTKSNYFSGGNPNVWHRNIPTFSSVKYQDIYPGVDLIFYGNQNQLEYDFVVAPGYSPEKIVLEFSGPETVEIDDEGSLLLQYPSEQIRFEKPFIYQEIEGKRQGINGAYALLEQNRVTFQVDAYNVGETLVIDPKLVYATYLGGSDYEYVSGIAVDAANNAYIVGTTQSPDFPVTAGAFQTSPANEPYEVFVTKLNSSGTEVLYSTYLGGSGDDRATDVALDGMGNSYLVGSTASSDFPVTEGSLQMTYQGGWADGFVTKLSADGASLLYSTYLGSPGGEYATGIAVDTGGRAYISGWAHDEDFPTTSGALQRTPGGGNDAFISKLSVDGSSLVYSTFLGGKSNDEAGRIAIDPAGNGYVTGGARSTDFPTTPGAFQTSKQTTEEEVFVSKLNPEGSALVYSTYLGGSGQEGGFDIGVDGDGNAYVVGITMSTDFPTSSSAVQKLFGGGSSDAFVAKLNAEGTALLYSTFLGGSESDAASAIALDDAGKVWISGSTGSPDFPVVEAFQAGQGGFTDGFLTKLGPEGNSLLYSSYLGGSDNEGALVAIDGKGVVYLAGETFSTDFPVKVPFQAENSGNLDAYIAKISEEAPAPQSLASFYFPQFADGAGGTLQFQSTLILANTGLETSVRVELYSTPDGAPMSLRLGELGTDSIFEFTLGEGESISLPTPGTGEMQVGYARVVAGPDVNGVLVFQRTDLTSGISLYEAGVPASTALKEFCLFVDSLGVRDTGFALVYPPVEEGSSPTEKPDANVTLRLYDKQYNLIAERSLDPMAPGSHTARFVYEMFDDPGVKAQAQEMEGMLVVESDQAMVAVTVRQNDDPLREFPQEVPILTTFPVIPGAPE